jgi:hypothetical protein
VQESELQQNKKQENNDRTPRNEEVLPLLPEAPTAPRVKVVPKYLLL